MSEKEQSANPYFKLWLDNQERFFQNQAEWLDSGSRLSREMDKSPFAETTRSNWKQCEEQLSSWMETAGNWFTDAKQQTDDEGLAAEALGYMLKPNVFFNTGFEPLHQFMHKLAEGPEFADIGLLERKMFKSGRDWIAMNQASDAYQQVIASAWSRAFKTYSDEFLKHKDDANISSKAWLERWLAIADEELTTTMRSEEFLTAQREFFRAFTKYRLKYREFAEMWCESHTIPTRSEVDDLHKMLYELRREVRELKRQVHKEKKRGKTNG